jgi:anti-anti-sigma factor
VSKEPCVNETATAADEPVVVELAGPDGPDGTPELRFQLHDVVLSGARCIVVDASSLDAIPSAAIAAMLTAHRACRRRGGRLMIRHPSRRALDQLARTGLWRVLEVESR